MAEDLDNKFDLLNKAVRSRDPAVLQSWEAIYHQWVHVDHKGTCPFETANALKRAFTIQPHQYHI
jgi:hypothetical protein